MCLSALCFVFLLFPSFPSLSQCRIEKKQASDNVRGWYLVIVLQECLATVVHDCVDGGDQDNRLGIQSRVESVSDNPDASAVSGSV